MKGLFLPLFIVHCTLIAALAQPSSMGINNLNPSTNAALDVKTTTGFNQGMFIPRLGSTWTAGLGATDEGLMFYNTTSDSIQYWTGTKWLSLASNGIAPSAIWTKSGTSIYPTTLTDNVGIGTSSPAYKLHVSGGNLALALFETAGGNKIRINDNVIDALNNAGSGGADLILNPGGVYSGGNVGVGTTSPSQKLHVQNGDLFISGIPGFVSNGDRAYLYLGDNNNYINAVVGSGLMFSAYQAPDMVTFQQTTGNVGIGTTNPAAKLEVAVPGRSAYVGDPGCGIGYAGIGLHDAMASCTNYSMIGDASNLFINRPGGSILFRMNNLDQMILTTTGNLGIGTTNPLYKLEVAGSTNLNSGIAIGAAILVNGSEALWFNGTYFSWGFSSSANYFARPVGIGTTAPTASLEVNGYTKLGSGAPAIQIKELTGVTGNVQGNGTLIVHGLDPNNILSMSVFVRAFGVNIFVPENTPSAQANGGTQFSYWINNQHIGIELSSANSYNILNAPIRIMIVYK